MRSTRPIPGNPWPHDMQITVEDRSQSLLDLLWLREAFQLPVDAGAPPPLVDTPALASRTLPEAERTEWAKAWPRVWDAAVRHAATERDPDLFAQLRDTTIDPAQRGSLLQRLVGPSWRDEFDGDVFLDRSHVEWERRSFDAHIASRSHRLANSPEHRDLDALIPAWRNGLTRIVTIPCRGDHTRVMPPAGLLVTEGTRSDSAAYRAALGQFVV